MTTDQQVRHTIRNLPAAVEQGIMIGLDGVIGGLGGVTLSGAPQGGDVTVVLQGTVEMQVLNNSVAYDDDEFIEVDANGRARQFSAGTKVGYALANGSNPVGGVYALKEVYLFGKKTDPAVAATFATLDITVGALAADVIRLTAQLQDQDGNDLAEEDVEVLIKAYELTMIDGLVADWTLTAVTGTLQTTDAQAAVIMKTNAAGLVVVDMEDVGSDKEGIFPVEFQILNRACNPAKQFAYPDFTDA